MKGSKHATPSARDILFPYLLGNDDLAGKKIVDLFAGGGGVSTGIEQALGRSPDVAINHDAEAIAMHQANHPLTRHYQTDVFEVDPAEAVGDAPVGLLWLSPDCKHHSSAKGGAPLDHGIRSLAWVALKWAGKKRPNVIVLENVPAFTSWGRLVARRGHYDADGKKIKAKDVPWPNRPKRKGKQCRRWKKGMVRQQPPRGPVRLDAEGRMELHADRRPRYQGRTFRRFKASLEGLGYVVEHQVLVAADYGVPTIRKRLFLVARCDGKPIVWPTQTHAAPDDPRVRSGELQPWRTAAECIDWSIPTRSVFVGPDRKHPLKPKTLARVALGIQKYTLGSRAPFLVMCAHGGHDSRQKGTDAPLWTVTSANDGIGLVTPYLVPMNADNPATSPLEPLGTVTTGNRFYLTMPCITSYYGDKGAEVARGQSVDACLNTIPTANRHGLVSALLVRHNDGGLDPKYAGYSAGEPARTVTASGGPHALVSAALVQYNGTSDAQPAGAPVPTLSTVERFGVMTAHVLREFSSGHSRSLTEPLASQTTVKKDGIVMASLTPAFTEEVRVSARKVFELMNRYAPGALAGLSAEDRADQLVTLMIAGEKYVIWDIGMRMLTPRELYLCQGFPVDYQIDISIGGRELSKDAQVRMCGNSVPPAWVAAVVGAQFEPQMREAAD